MSQRAGVEGGESLEHGQEHRKAEKNLLVIANRNQEKAWDDEIFRVLSFVGSSMENIDWTRTRSLYPVFLP